MPANEPGFIPPANYDPLWADDFLYSDLRLAHEVRIVDTEVSRRFYYLTANINPAAYALLKKNAGKLPQPIVKEFLEKAKFIDWDSGYEWMMYAREIIGDEKPEKMLRDATNKIITLHKIVLQLMPPKT